MGINCNNPPILIAATPKSGSSLIASIFVAHGLWVGRHKPKPYYESFSNYDIDRLLRKRNRARRDFIELFRAINPKNERWILKGKPRELMEIASYLQKFHIVKVRRDKEHLMNSRKPDAVDAINIHTKQMEYLTGPIVETEQVVRGDFTTLKVAFDHCNVIFRPELARSRIKPELWSSLKS